MSFVKKLQELVDNYSNVRYKETIKFCRKIKEKMIEEAKDGHTSLTIYVDTTDDDIDPNLIVTYFSNRGLIIKKSKGLGYCVEITFSWEEQK